MTKDDHMTKLTVILLAACAAFATPAFAQDDRGITLRVDAGTVMSSTGSEYVSANTGKPLVVGEKLMVNAGSSATAVYEGGCTVEFKEAGVYEVPGECKKAAWINSGSGNGMNAAVIVGAAVIGAALLNSEDSVDVGPLSTGARHL
jgi:hypothetical protein